MPLRRWAASRLSAAAPLAWYFRMRSGSLYFCLCMRAGHPQRVLDVIDRAVAGVERRLRHRGAKEQVRGT